VDRLTFHSAATLYAPLQASQLHVIEAQSNDIERMEMLHLIANSEIQAPPRPESLLSKVHEAAFHIDCHGLLQYIEDPTSWSHAGRPLGNQLLFRAQRCRGGHSFSSAPPRYFPLHIYENHGIFVQTLTKGRPHWQSL
jgi:hypothetical protein